MLNSIEALQYLLLGRPIYDWLLSILVCLVSFAVLKLVAMTATARLQTLAKRSHKSAGTRLDKLSVDLLSSTKSYFLWACSAYVASRLLNPAADIETVLRRSFALATIFQAAAWGRRMISFWIENYLRKRTQNDVASATTVSLINTLANTLLYATLFLLVLNNFGVNITALVAGLGVGGIAVALAAQNILGDLFSSLTIVLDKPFVVGDAIKVEDLGGTVEHIGLKTTRLKALSGEQLIFSNSDILKSRVHNFKRMSERRVVLLLSVSYATPANTLQEIPSWIRRIVESQPKIQFDRCHLAAFAGPGIQFELVYIVLSADFSLHMDVQQEILMSVIRLFEKERVELASRAAPVYLTNP